MSNVSVDDGYGTWRLNLLIIIDFPMSLLLNY